MNRPPFCCLLVGLSPFLSFGAMAFAAPGSIPDDPRFFETRIRPVLAEKCFTCHGDKLQQGKLRLDNEQGMRKGGSRGPAVISGDPDHSLLIRSIRHEDAQLKMPLGGARLSDREIAELVTWVKMGARWPQVRSAPRSEAEWRPQESHWAFQPLRRLAVPRVARQGWVKSPIDEFILSALEKKGLTPAPPAQKRVFLRRVYFDLIGLPPTPEELSAFVNDTSPDALAKVVDRLLESPRYGERWGRHWLDCVRYADSNGLDENYHWANAWRYRDYVVDAFNRDLPYDQFVVEQLAGDLVPMAPGESEEDRYRRIIATGFLMIGPKLIANPDKAKVALDIIDEQIDTTSRAFLGLTVSCARCHDHKFDPIKQSEYYAIAGIFKSTRTMKNLQERIWMERPLASTEAVARAEAHKQALEAKQKELTQAKSKKLPDDEQKRLQREVERLQHDTPPALPYAMAVEDAEVNELPLYVRGDHNNPSGTPIARQVPAALRPAPQPAFRQSSSGRLEFAHWLASPENPLTARVLVNRVWQWHFGRGLVATSENFGKLGEQPTHPELLDYLSRKLIEGGWSIKRLNREIVLSSAYRMSTAVSPESLRHDPENRLLSRMNRQRLDAEALRDTILRLSGSLDLQMGGTLLADVPNMQRVTTDQSEDFAQKSYAIPRRSVYMPIVRNSLLPMFELFDFADPSSVSPRRPETIVAPQALFLLNNPIMLANCRSYAERLLKEVGPDDPARIRHAFREVFGREPSAGETARAKQHLDSCRMSYTLRVSNFAEARLKAWQNFCQVLLSSNEFYYVD